MNAALSKFQEAARAIFCWQAACSSVREIAHDGSAACRAETWRYFPMGAAVNGHRPSADVLFHSWRRNLRSPPSGVFDDPAWAMTATEGLGAIKAAGGMTIRAE